MISDLHELLRECVAVLVVAEKETPHEWRKISRFDLRRRINAALAQPEQGWKLVPVEPTEEIISAFSDQVLLRFNSVTRAEIIAGWKVALVAAPLAGKEKP